MLTSIAFILITIISVFLFYLATDRSKLVLVFFPIWGGIVAILSYVGFYKNLNVFPPRFLLILIPVTLYVIYFYRKIDIPPTKIPYLLAIHGLRLPVELVLYSLFTMGQAPIVMTFSGWNYDILVGITALLLLGYTLATKKQFQRQFFLIWNVLGILFLTTIVSIAVLSIPLPIQQFGFKQPNMAVISYPYALLPAIVVPIVLLSHLYSLKMLSHLK
ncbi:MAG TPA: hypothetical protein DCS93_19515 [Microscillaceae bacterium]|nr:hypothetical protein [Microscillaceae bacterium]